MNRFLPIIFIASTFSASTLHAKGNPEECVKLVENQSRLECYDAYFAEKVSEPNSVEPQLTEITVPTYSFEQAKP